MSVTYQTETVDEVIVEIMPLLLAHYQEIAWLKEKMPLNPQLDKYRALEAAGALKIYTARRDGALIGYAIFIVSTNLHYSVLQAQNDIMYVEPTHRGAAIGKRLTKDYAETELKALGVKVINLHIKRSHNWMKLAERWGYVETEATAQKWIGD